MNRRTRRWFECLTALKPSGDVNAFAARNGWKRHETIQRDFPHCVSEVLQFYVDATLPFDIGYHADLFDPRTKTVYEIKSDKWFNESKQNELYAIAQLSGYAHFKHTENAQFLLYSGDSYASLTRELMTWVELREIALKSDELLRSRGL